MRAIIATGACVLLAIGAQAAGGRQPDARPPLSGPVVPPRLAPALSLVERAFDGSVRAPDRPPEEAALDALGLTAPDATPAQRAAWEAASGVLAERARMLDHAVGTNIDLLVMLSVAEGTDDGLDKLMLGLKAYEVLAPLRAKGTLRAQIAGVLPEPERAEFERLLDEYWGSLVRDRRAQPKPDGGRPARGEIILAARGESFGREVERSFQRLVKSGELIYRYATRGIRLSVPQQRRLRELAADHAAKGDNASEEDNRRLFLGALRTLHVWQRPRFVRNLQGT
ncbi:MAG: hypothetical protein SFY69_08725 [Planctomycetota bacterium]|nr:hypothetical protein [Planctomycetota bacterium]